MANTNNYFRFYLLIYQLFSKLADWSKKLVLVACKNELIVYH